MSDVNFKEIARPADPSTPALPALPSLPAEPATPDSVKPGYETSEFWITLISTVIPNLITLLAIFKVVPNEIASTLATALVSVIGGIITIIVAIKYIKSRTEVKMKTLDIQATVRFNNRNAESARAQLYLQLLQNGVVTKEEIKKEFKL